MCARTVLPARRPVERKPGGAVEGLHTDDAVRHDRLLCVNIAKERVQRARPLRQTLAQLHPLVGVHHARYQVEREDLGTALTGNTKGDAVGALLLARCRLPATQLGHAQPGNGVEEPPVMLPWSTFGIDGFVIAVVEAATGEDDYRFATGLVAEQKGRVVTPAVAVL